MGSEEPPRDLVPIHHDRRARRLWRSASPHFDNAQSSSHHSARLAQSPGRITISLLPLLAWFMGGVFLTNAVPHLVAGLQGRRFQSPFAKPPGKGLSSPRSNVVWGFINLVLGWALLSQVGAFDIRHCIDAAALAAGILAMGLYLAGYFGRFYGND